MSEDPDRSTPRFTPLRPAPRSRLITAFVIGPVLWLVALIAVAVLLTRTNAIEIGLLIAVASFALSLLVLLLLRSARRRQERRYAARA
jgi:hypothetical protein